MLHAYEVRPHRDKRGVDLISDVLPFGRLWYGESDAVSNAWRGSGSKQRKENEKMKTVILITVLLVTYVTLKIAFSWLGWAFQRRKIARLDRLDQADNGNRLRSYYLEMQSAEQEIIAKWRGEFPRGTDGKVVRELAWRCLLCIEQNPSVMKERKTTGKNSIAAMRVRNPDRSPGRIDG